MAELIAFLVALPLLYGIGLFYWRLGVGLYRALATARTGGIPSVQHHDLPQDSRYEVALATAQAIIHQLSERPDMPDHERLAGVTYAILEILTPRSGCDRSLSAYNS